MDSATWFRAKGERRSSGPSNVADRSEGERLRPDGGEESERAEPTGADRSNVEITESGEAEPSDPRREKPDPEDIPEFEIRTEEPPMGGHAGGESADGRPQDPTGGRPNTARAPGASGLDEGDTEGYVAALELCARLPDDLRLPEEAADLVPAAVEAELEGEVQTFAAAEFDNPSPHVDTLSFVEADDEIWVRLRLGVPPEAFASLDPEEVRAHALQELDGLL